MIFKNKITEYLLYAVGEIILVVIGILIALQINDANEHRQKKEKVNNYKISLISELKEDIKRLDQLDTLYQNQQIYISQYLQYFKRPDNDVTILIEKMNLITFYGDFFKSITYTIDDIINTGNLELFDKKTKHAILEFKATQEFFDENRSEVVQKWLLSNLEFEEEVDMLSFGNSQSGNSQVNNKWLSDINSREYRLYNNSVLALLRTYYFRTNQNNRMRKSIQKLKTVLEEEHLK